MQRLTAFARAVTLTVIVLSLGTILGAQSNPAYIRFTPNATKGALYKPDRGPAPAVAVLLIHRTGNFSVTPCDGRARETWVSGAGHESSLGQ